METFFAVNSSISLVKSVAVLFMELVQIGRFTAFMKPCLKVVCAKGLDKILVEVRSLAIGHSEPAIKVHFGVLG